MPRRLTRKEQQAQTRSCLIQSAARVFSRHGLEGASIDDVAADAGYTKGAFYANFKSKEELFLAMLDEHFANRLNRLDELMATEEPPSEQARNAAMDFVRYVEAERDWERLFFEFAAHASRDEDFRQELVTRYGAMRERIAQMYSRRLERLGLEPPVPPEQFAVMIFAMGNGIALEKLLEPDAVSEETYGTMMQIFFGGLGTIADAEQRGALT